MLSRFVFFLACFLFTSAVFAQTIPLDSAVRTGTLDNGFTYYIRRNEEPKNRVDLDPREQGRIGAGRS